MTVGTLTTQLGTQWKGYMFVCCFFLFVCFFICWVCFAILCSSIGTKLTWKLSLTPGGVDEKRTGIQKRYKQICNILSVGRGLSPPDKRNNINFLLRHTLVLVLDRSHHVSPFCLLLYFRCATCMIVALFCIEIILCRWLQQQIMSIRTAGVCSIFAFTFRPILYFAYF